MKRDLQFPVWLYRACLKLFPKRYREEYGEELQAIFRLSLDNARQGGKLEMVRWMMREFSSLPKAALLEHLRESRRSRMIGANGAFFDFAPGTPRELGAAAAPFLLFGALTVLLAMSHTQGIVSSSLVTSFEILTLAIVAGLFLIGILKGMPRWFMPYLGLPLPIISILIFARWLNDWNGFNFYQLRDWSWLLGEFVYQGLVWVGLAGSVLLLVMLVHLFSRFHPLFHRLKRDWTLLCFIVYGAAPLVLVVTFEGYKYEEPCLVLSFLVLALFARIYLRGTDQMQKFLALYTGIGLTMAIVAVGKLFIVPFQDWPVTFSNELSVSEALSTVVMWSWLALIMWMPPFFQLLFRSEHPQT